MLTYVFAALFAASVVMIIFFMYRIVTAVPEEDRTYADKPPRLLLKIWPLVEIAAHYVGPRLSVEYREKTIRRLRKVELDYAVSPQQWFAARLVYAVLIGLLVTGMCYWLDVKSVIVPVLGFVFGFFYLELWLRDRLKQVEIEVLKHLPPFLDMLTLAIESGCNMTVGINIAVDKTPDNALRRAFARLLREIRSGRNRIDALRSMEDRIDLAVVSSLVSALVQAEKTGASLGTVLRAQSTQRTNERFARAEKLAMEAPVKMLGPLIFCIFPCTFVVLGFPIGMKMLDAIK